MPPNQPRAKAAPRMAPQQRREQILDSTLTLMAKDGYGGTTMQSIARAAGVAKPVVYEFYRDRTELLQDLLARESQKALALSRSAFRAAQAGESLNESIRWTMDATLDIAAAAPETWRLILMAPAGAPAEIRASVSAAREALIAQIQTNVTKQVGTPSPPLDTELLAFALLVVCEAAARLLLTDPDTFSRQRLSTAIDWVGEHLRFDWST